MLRLDWNLLFNIINLIILYALMKRFLFKPVNAILEKRQQEADARFVQADAQEAAAQEKAQKYDSLLEDAQNEKGAHRYTGKRGSFHRVWPYRSRCEG